MRRSLSWCFVYCFVQVLFCAQVQAYEKACEVSPILPTAPGTSMFTPAQEVELGEVFAESFRHSAYEIDDDDLDAYLQQLGDGLANHIPSTELKLRFFLSDMPVANAVSFPGGRVPDR